MSRYETPPPAPTQEQTSELKSLDHALENLSEAEKRVDIGKLVAEFSEWLEEGDTIPCPPPVHTRQEPGLLSRISTLLKDCLS